MALYEYKIVAGWNGTPANVEGISVATTDDLSTALPILDQTTHYIVQALGNYEVPYQTTAGGFSQNGYAVIRWIFPVISDYAFAHLIDTYGQASSQNGKVTINTRLHTRTYVEKNAYLFVNYPNQPMKKLRDNLYVYDEGVVTASLRIVGDTV